MMRVGLVIYGSLETLTGGYLSNRRLRDHLVSRGDQVEVDLVNDCLGAIAAGPN